MAEGERPKAELGCWTLVLIAIIVMIFSDQGGSRKLRRKIDELNTKIDRLEKKIDDLQKRLPPAPAPQPAKR